LRWYHIFLAAEGLSSSTVNVLWGFLNIVIFYVLVCRVGDFNARDTGDAAALLLGVLSMALLCARLFGRFYGGDAPQRR
jgi:hypothetical protein